MLTVFKMVSIFICLHKSYKKVTQKTIYSYKIKNMIILSIYCCFRSEQFSVINQTAHPAHFAHRKRKNNVK